MADKYESDTPGPYRRENGITVSIEPFTEGNKFRFIKLQMNESIGGEIAYGSVILNAAEVPAGEELFRKQNGIHIIVEQEDPHDKYDIFGFIIHRDYAPGTGILQFNFLCTPIQGQDCLREFFSLTRSTVFKEKKIKDVISAVWKDTSHMKFFEKAVSDLPVMDYHQERESDLEFLKKLSYGYLKDTVFAIGLEGYTMKKIKDKDREYPDKDEPYRCITGGEITQSDEAVNMNYNYKLYRNIENPCTEGETLNPGKEISKNFSAEILDNEYRVYGKGYSELQGNYRHNTRLMESSLYSSITVRYTQNLPPWRIGDTVKYGGGGVTNEPKGDKGELSTYIITSIDWFISADPQYKDQYGMTFSTTAVLRGIQSVDGTQLPEKFDQDPGQSQSFAAQA